MPDSGRVRMAPCGKDFRAARPADLIVNSMIIVGMISISISITNNMISISISINNNNDNIIIIISIAVVIIVMSRGPTSCG